MTDLIAELEAQKQRIVFDSFTHDDAWELGLLLHTLAVERGLGIAIDVTKGDQQVFHAALPGTTPDNDDWIARKIRTVRRFGEASFLVGRRFAAADTDFNEKTGLPFTEFVAHGGCVPIIVRNVGPVGTVTVSGLPQADDHALAIEAIEMLLSR
jgi:uncharacterized protein (UPF0303 family)